MSKLNPPPLNIASPSPRPRPTTSLPTSNGESPPVFKRKPKSFSTQFAAAVRWLHIYVSLLGFTALVFFSITGVTLNHPDWFGVDAESVAELQGQMKVDWLQSGTPNPDDPAAGVSKLEVVEHLRAAHGLRGAVGEFRVDDVECLVVFKGPGYAADVIVQRETGAYTITETKFGSVAIINDLHKGRDSGFIWSLIIDGTALLTIFVSVTGVVLLFYIKRKRFAGVVTAVVGTIALAVVYAIWVP